MYYKATVFEKEWSQYINEQNDLWNKIKSRKIPKNEQ